MFSIRTLSTVQVRYRYSRVWRPTWHFGLRRRCQQVAT